MRFVEILLSGVIIVRVISAMRMTVTKEQCPIFKNQWERKAGRRGCRSPHTYHCFRASGDKFVEVCLYKFVLRAIDGCPYIKLDSTTKELLYYFQCRARTGCPKSATEKEYFASELFKYPACIVGNNYNESHYRWTSTKTTSSTAHYLPTLEDKDSQQSSPTFHMLTSEPHLRTERQRPDVSGKSTYVSTNVQSTATFPRGSLRKKTDEYTTVYSTKHVISKPEKMDIHQMFQYGGGAVALILAINMGCCIFLCRRNWKSHAAKGKEQPALQQGSVGSGEGISVYMDIDQLNNTAENPYVNMYDNTESNGQRGSNGSARDRQSIEDKEKRLTYMRLDLLQRAIESDEDVETYQSLNMEELERDHKSQTL